MCGFAGAVSLSERGLRTSRLKGMVDVIAHRGPDDAGYWVGRLDGSAGRAFADRDFRGQAPDLPCIDAPEARAALADPAWTLFLGHRRLSIIDLSPAGHQPMASEDGAVWLVYNGEIYNFRELRGELESLGHRFRGRSDSEVLLHAYLQWGTDCLPRLNGMFAFALYDRRAGCLVLARDRYGVKPVYYGVAGGALLFGSEIKSLLAYAGAEFDVDLLALNEYFSFQNVLSDRTLFEGVKLLPPGHFARIDPRQHTLDTTRYWDFDYSQEIDAPAEAIHEELYHHIEAAVRRQCVSDVPVGSYLSGGLDSGAVTAVAARELGRIFSFTLGFDLSEAAEHEQHFDERPLAERMANRFQTEHYECVLHSGDMEAVIDPLVWHLEDLRVGQCYPNYYVAGLASKFVSVVLSGVGGDEIFGGYPWRYAAAVGANTADFRANYYRYWQRLVSNADKRALFAPDTREALSKLRDGDAVPFVNHTLDCFSRVFRGEVRAATPADQVRQSLYFESKTFLHGLLVVEDKLSMAHSLESRVPYLDNELVDFAARIPIHLKVDGVDALRPIDENLQRKNALYGGRSDAGKNVLRRSLEHILPPDITQAPKQGFSAPDESWFRGRSEEFVRDTLTGSGARLREYLSPEFVSQCVENHSSGRENKRLLIWSLLCFETWLRQFRSGGAADART